MVSRPTTDRQIFNLQNAQSANAWILSFVAKWRAENKEDKINTDGTVQDLQVTYGSFLVCAGQMQLLSLGS